MFSKPEIKDLFKQYQLTDLYTDKVPPQYVKDPQRQDEYAEINREFQEKAFGDIRLPLYAILEPVPNSKKIRVVGTYTEGKINSQEAFATWLKKYLGEDTAQAQAGR